MSTISASSSMHDFSRPAPAPSPSGLQPAYTEYGDVGLRRDYSYGTDDDVLGGGYGGYAPPPSHQDYAAHSPPEYQHHSARSSLDLPVSASPATLHSSPAGPVHHHLQHHQQQYGPPPPPPSSFYAPQTPSSNLNYTHHPLSRSASVRVGSSSRPDSPLARSGSGAALQTQTPGRHPIPLPSASAFGGIVTARKRKLTIEQKQAICRIGRENPGMKQDEIAKKFGVDRSTISKILSDPSRWETPVAPPTPRSMLPPSSSHLSSPAHLSSPHKSPSGGPRFPTVEAEMDSWLDTLPLPAGTTPSDDPERLSSLPSDLTMREKAKDIARSMGFLPEQFRASPKWLERFMQRRRERKRSSLGATSTGANLVAWQPTQPTTMDFTYTQQQPPSSARQPPTGRILHSTAPRTFDQQSLLLETEYAGASALQFKPPSSSSSVQDDHSDWDPPLPTFSVGGQAMRESFSQCSTTSSTTTAGSSFLFSSASAAGSMSDYHTRPGSMSDYRPDSGSVGSPRRSAETQSPAFSQFSALELDPGPATGAGAFDDEPIEHLASPAEIHAAPTGAGVTPRGSLNHRSRRSPVISRRSSVSRAGATSPHGSHPYWPTTPGGSAGGSSGSHSRRHSRGPGGLVRSGSLSDAIGAGAGPGLRIVAPPPAQMQADQPQLSATSAEFPSNTSSSTYSTTASPAASPAAGGRPSTGGSERLSQSSSAGDEPTPQRRPRSFSSSLTPFTSTLHLAPAPQIHAPTPLPAASQTSPTLAAETPTPTQSFVPHETAAEALETVQLFLLQHSTAAASGGAHAFVPRHEELSAVDELLRRVRESIEAAASAA